jgi:hypothetical protein
MRKTMAVTLALTTGVLIAAGSAVGASSAKPKTYTVHMKGSLEVPKGSPTGTGLFHYQLVTKTGLFCYDLKWSKNIGTPVAAHVHKGAKGTAGPVVIPLSLKPPVAHSGCVKVKKSLLSAIKKKPSAYYVNVHTPKYPGGAIRGQL